MTISPRAIPADVYTIIGVILSSASIGYGGDWILSAIGHLLASQENYWVGEHPSIIMEINIFGEII
jgi:hypothetical protein